MIIQYYILGKEPTTRYSALAGSPSSDTPQIKLKQATENWKNKRIKSSRIAMQVNSVIIFPD